MESSIAELVRVHTADDYVGQEALKAHIDIKIRAAETEGRLFDHTLLIGPAGAGKTSLVQVIARRLNDELLVLDCAGLKYNDFLYEVEQHCGGIIFLDEIHNLPRAFQEQLQVGLGPVQAFTDRFGDTVNASHVTFIGATTHADRNRLLPPLVQRFKYRPSWEPYTTEEMTRIVTGMASRVGVDIPADVCAGLGAAAGGNPRAVQDLVASARDLAAVGEPITVESVLRLAGLDGDGLTPDHLDYLRALHAMRGVAGLSTLENMTGLPKQTIADLERTLVMRGYVRRTGSGRKLMDAGKAKIDQNVGHTDVRTRRQRRSA